jgi:hypothetical protein
VSTVSHPLGELLFKLKLKKAEITSLRQDMKILRIVGVDVK